MKGLPGALRGLYLLLLIVSLLGTVLLLCGWGYRHLTVNGLHWQDKVAWVLARVWNVEVDSLTFSQPQRQLILHGVRYTAQNAHAAVQTVAIKKVSVRLRTNPLGVVGALPWALEAQGQGVRVYLDMSTGALSPVIPDLAQPMSSWLLRLARFGRMQTLWAVQDAQLIWQYRSKTALQGNAACATVRSAPFDAHLNYKGLWLGEPMVPQSIATAAPDVFQLQVSRLGLVWSKHPGCRLLADQTATMQLEAHLKVEPISNSKINFSASASLSLQQWHQKNATEVLKLVQPGAKWHQDDDGSYPDLMRSNLEIKNGQWQSAQGIFAQLQLRHQGIGEKQSSMQAQAGLRVNERGVQLDIKRLHYAEPEALAQPRSLPAIWLRFAQQDWLNIQRVAHFKVSWPWSSKQDYPLHLTLQGQGVHGQGVALSAQTALFSGALNWQGEGGAQIQINGILDAAVQPLEHVQHLSLRSSWERRYKVDSELEHWQLRLEQVMFGGAFFSGQAQGMAQLLWKDQEVISLSGTGLVQNTPIVVLSHHLSRYGSDHLKNYLQQAQPQGMVQNLDLQWLWSKQQPVIQIEASASVIAASLTLAPKWPRLNHISGILSFDRHAFDFSGQGRYGETLVHVQQIQMQQRNLQVQGWAEGDAQDFLAFFQRSPLSAQSAWLSHAQNQVNGGMHLDLDFSLDFSKPRPLYHLAGELHFQQVQFQSAALRLDKMEGILHLSKQGLAVLPAQPLTLSAWKNSIELFGHSRQGKLEATVRGRLPGKELAALSGQRLSTPQQLHWHAKVSGRVGAQPGVFSIAIQSELGGLTLGQSLSWKALLQQDGPLDALLNIDFGTKEFTLGAWLHAQRLAFKLSGRFSSESDLVVDKPYYWRCVGAQEQLNLNQWLIRSESDLRADWVGSGLCQTQHMLTALKVLPALLSNKGLSAPRLQTKAVTVSLKQMRLFQQPIRQLRAVWHLPSAGNPATILSLVSPQLRGQISWQLAAQGGYSLKVDLKRLVVKDLRVLPEALEQAYTQWNVSPGHSALLDVAVDVKDLQVAGEKIGQLSVQGAHFLGQDKTFLASKAPLSAMSFVQISKIVEQMGGWKWKVDVDSPENHLRLRGYRVAQPVYTRVMFSGRTENIDALAHLEESLTSSLSVFQGVLGWQGAGDFSQWMSNLQGSLKFSMHQGRLSKVNIGLGRLLAALSLRSLPRRARLDFRDVLLEGFEFRVLRGDFSVFGGILKTQNFKLLSSIANLNLSGELDLVSGEISASTRAEVHLGDSISTLGILTGNPATAVIIAVANYIFERSFSKLIYSDTKISGHWRSPVIER